MIKRTTIYYAKLVLSVEAKSSPVPRTTKLNGRPIQKSDRKVMRVIYTIWSKNLTNKVFYENFSANDRKFIRCKETKNICKKLFSFRVKKLWDRQIPRKFPQPFIIGTTAYRRLKLTSVSSNWLK